MFLVGILWFHRIGMNVNGRAFFSVYNSYVFLIVLSNIILRSIVCDISYKIDLR